MTTYRQLKGYNVKRVDSDPTNPQIGQVWYNDTINQIKVRTQVAAAWASGGNLNTARTINGTGTQTAGLGFGGNAPPPSNNEVGKTEEYDGSAWSEQNDLNTARLGMGGAGTQTAGLAFAGRLAAPPSTLKDETEEYNGTAWTEQNDINTARINLGGCGTQQQL